VTLETIAIWHDEPYFFVVRGDRIYGYNPSSGSIYSVGLDGTGRQTLYSFPTFQRNLRFSGLDVEGSTIYGTTQWGGVADLGTVFALNTSGSDFHTLFEFRDFFDGSVPHNLIAYDGILYGLTSGPQGLFSLAADGIGGIFAINPDGTNYHIAVSMSGSLASPFTFLTSSDQTIFGVTSPLSSNPSVFSANVDGSNLTALHPLPAGTQSGVIGVTVLGNQLFGVSGSEIFSMNLDGSGYQVLRSGITALSNLVPGGDKLYGVAQFGGAPMLYSITVPEPSSIALGMIALASLTVVALRRARQSTSL
jgi:hypothetical protein